MSRIHELLPAEAVVLQLESTEKVAVIRELTRLLGTDVVADEKALLEAILRRENLESTGIGMGVALPHARTLAVRRTALAFGRSDKGVDFNSLDSKPCHLVFLIVAPEDRKTEYIMTLARVSKLLRRQDVRSELGRADTPEALLEVLRSHE
ncbi:MAG: PTS sugar transporter subunit IIA [candidate division WOR-3 bacterium]|nr:MAG: PTS sugar transporter subunit IIA [candidate division WOR-3 bacterium]